MKKSVVFIIFSLLISFYSYALDKYEALSIIKQSVEESKTQLPLKVSNITFQSVEIRDNDYICNIIIDEDKIDYEYYYETMSENKMDAFSRTAGNKPAFAEAFAKSGLNYVINITGEQSHRQRQIFLSSKEINSSLTSRKNTQLDDNINDFISEAVEGMKEDLPEDWGDGLTLTDVYIENKYLVYKIHTDESILTIGLLKMSKNDGELENTMIDSFNETDDVFAILFINQLKQSGMGVKYVYWSNKTEETVNVILTPEMMRDKVNVKF